MTKSLLQALPDETLDKHGRRLVLYVCVCGNSVYRLPNEVRSLHVKSCGCWRREVSRKNHQTHGEGRISTPEYRSWKHMKERVLNPKCSTFKHYGGRGIKLCKRWLHSYQNFLADMGRKPTIKHSLDRINNDGNYEPGNCRWATQYQQVHNRRLSKKATNIQHMICDEGE